MARPLLLITGIAGGFGAETATTFARAGHDVVGLSRSDRHEAEIRRSVEAHDGCYVHVVCDVTSPGKVAAALAPYAGRISVLVHNAHQLLIKPFEKTSAIDFEHVWRVTCLGAILSAQAVVPHMAARGSGTLIFTGATAGLRGSANSRPSRPPNSHYEGSRSRWRANSAPRASMWRISCSTV